MDQILLLLKSENEEDLFKKILSKNYGVLTSEKGSLPEESFDLCILDEFNLNRIKAEVAAIKQAADGFLPFLFLNLSDQNLTEISTVLQFIDEQIFAPVREAELLLRVKNLLERRKLSLQVTPLASRNGAPADGVSLEENFFKLVFDHSPDAIFIHPWEREGFNNFLHVNRVACKRYGYSCEEFLKLSPADISDATDVQSKGAAEIRKILADKGHMTFEATHLTKEGKKIPVEISSRVFRYGNNKAILSIARDISAQKKSEDELKRSEESYRLLFENSPVPLWEEDYSEMIDYLEDLFASGLRKEDIAAHLDENPEILAECARRVRVENLNQAAVRLHEAKDKKDLLGKLEKILTKASYTTFRNEIVALVNGMHEFAAESQVKTLAGDVKDIFLSYVALEDDFISQKRKKTILIATMDITPLKNAQRALAMSLKELDQLYDLSLRARRSKGTKRLAKEALRAIRKAIQPDVALFYLKTGEDLQVLAIDSDIEKSNWIDTKIHHVSECLCGMTAVSGKSTFSKNIFSDVRCTRNECKKAGIHSFAGLPLLAGEDVIGVIGLGSLKERDFSQQRAFLETLANEAALGLQNSLLLEQLRKHEADLENEVAVRTAELLEANKELESFSYSVSHDLRSPLRAIDGFSGIISEKYSEKLDQEAKRLIGLVRKNTQRMSNLIDDLLALSRIGRHAFLFTDVKMKELFEKVYQEITDESQRQKIQFQIAPIPDAKADSSLLQQVISNLLSNAIKFSGIKKNPKVEIDFKEKKDEIIYSVKDNGVGFDMKYADKLFQVFQRLHSSEEFPGTGIGLSIVHRIILRHGGRIWAKSKPGRGATFYFSLPKNPPV